MCGICGMVRFDGAPADADVLAGMIATLRHRGPDDEGVYTSGPVGLANSRLAVIDLSPAGHQPMSNAACVERGHGPLWIAFNGEVYNFPALRCELERRGHRLASHTDTEVILHLYEELGPACVERLRGMFAFALWDERRQRLFVARDRLGQKPLYYFFDGRLFAFGSEIKALLACPGVPRAVNVAAVPAYLAYGYVPTPDTMFRHVRQLPPGHTLLLEDGRLEVAEYWDVHYPAEPPPRSQQEYVEEVLRRLKEAVAMRLISDVPLGAFLSGGIDSTAVVALMSQAMSQPVKTFAIGFEGEPSFNELRWARLAAEPYGPDHHQFVVRPDAVELLPKLVWHHDQPFADSSAIPTYLVSKLTREHVTVALNGDGGDELFAGYERFAAARLAERYGRLPGWVRGLASAAVAVLPESTSYRGFARRARRFVSNASRPLLDRYLGWVGLFDGDLRATVQAPQTSEVSEDGSTELAEDG